MFFSNRIKVIPPRMTGPDGVTKNGESITTPCYLSGVLFGCRISKLHAFYIPWISSHESTTRFCLVIFSSFYGIVLPLFYMSNFLFLGFFLPLCFALLTVRVPELSRKRVSFVITATVPPFGKIFFCNHGAARRSTRVESSIST